jgi:hypothetical protein
MGDIIYGDRSDCRRRTAAHIQLLFIEIIYTVMAGLASRSGDMIEGLTMRYVTESIRSSEVA